VNSVLAPSAIFKVLEAVVDLDAILVIYFQIARSQKCGRHKSVHEPIVALAIEPQSNKEIPLRIRKGAKDAALSPVMAKIALNSTQV